MRGVLHFQHLPTPYCPADTAEWRTQLSDWHWTHPDEHQPRRWAPTTFTRPATPTEVELLAHVGYPATSATEVRVTFPEGIRHRSFPNLPAVAGLPDPTT